MGFFFSVNNGKMSLKFKAMAVYIIVVVWMLLVFGKTLL